MSKGDSVNKSIDDNNEVVNKDIDKKPKKKGPGRPPKNKTKITFKVDGVSPAPKDENNVMEMIYYNPKLFKKIYSLFKSYAAECVKFKFYKDKMVIVAKDHLKHTDIHITINCNKVSHYYCSPETENNDRDYLQSVTKREEMEDIFATMDKMYSKLVFVLHNDNFRSILNINTRDNEMENEDDWEVELIPDMDDNDFEHNDSIDYPIQFTMPSRHFKKKIGDISKFSKSIFIQQDGKNSPLKLTFEKRKKTSLYSTYKNSETIKLQSTIGDDQYFSVKVNIEDIKPFSNANIGDNVKICASENNKILFITESDKDPNDEYIATIRVYTEIVVADNE